jgi:hypothetical protein
VILSTSMSRGFNVNGASSVGVCDGALQPGQLLPSSNIPGHLGVTSLQQCNNGADLSCCFHPSPDLGSMPPGLPASSPRSFSSTGSLSSLVHNQVGLPSLSQLKQQETQLHHHLQRTGFHTRHHLPLLLTDCYSQMLTMSC